LLCIATAPYASTKTRLHKKFVATWSMVNSEIRTMTLIIRD
jgi:hypothetical protein